MAWVAEFVRWYKHDYRYGGIRCISPAQRRAGEDQTILAARHALHLKARQLKPARWSGHTRDWTSAGPVTLNPERDSVVSTAAAQPHAQPMAACPRRQRP